ncbi:histidine kinase [Prosthecochloris sp. ZM]|uniref:SpoIIE family protein phosphatase n=1 Tax=Prosthecochloris sp. ZM TaxID=2283143 RepID=UPI000DF787A3|nr:SpoIIE family protein phosphatase [Prosthecochloris sp. ZM]RDD30374.1 histidine kinase [Prosthecochloris sp. ZM]
MKQQSDMVILFVDDESDILNSMKRFLRREPYQKQFASGAEDALEIMKQTDVDIIVSDLRMPGMNGIDLIKSVKKQYPDTLRLILSGSQDIDQIIASINSGEVFRFILKPVEPDMLKSILRDAIEYHSMKNERDELFQTISEKNLELTTANRKMKNMTDKLERSERQLRSIHDAAQDAVFMLDERGTIVYRNTTAEKLLGFSTDENPEQRCSDLLSVPSSQLDYFEICNTNKTQHLPAASNEVIRADGLAKNGTVIPLEISKGYVHIDARPHTVVIARDITSRIEEEESRQRYDAMQKELESQIEKKLLQSPAPISLHHASISRLMISSGHLAGDFTDFIVYDPQHTDILIGDVMGHGIQSALVGAGIKALFLKTLAETQHHIGSLPGLHESMQNVHKYCIHELIDLGTYATLMFLRLDLEKKTMAMIDCGHPPAIHFQSSTNSCELLKGSNLPIGMLDHESYEVSTTALESNDIIVLYSDGLTECLSPEGTMFEIERLSNIIQHHHELPAQKLLETIQTELSTFSGKSTFGDDVSCIVIRIE